MSSSALPIFTVDAFSSRPFAGNPAAVCLLEQDIHDSLKQNLAMEMNLSETAYATKLNPEDSFSKSQRFGLRWFTRVHEVVLCGHATLATAAVIFQEMGNPNDVIQFETLSGVLEAHRNDKGLISLILPTYPPEAVSEDFAESVSEVVTTASGGLDVKEVLHSHGLGMLLVRLDDKYSMSDLECVRANPDRLEAADRSGTVSGVLLTLRGGVNSEYHFLSRFFAPWDGTPEDPVTGSSFSVLAPYWSTNLGETEMNARQCSQRGGDVKIKISENLDRVEISGHGTIVLRGHIRIQ